MDSTLFKMVENEMPKFNEQLAEGYAVSQLKTNEYYIDRVWRQVEMTFPPNLKYLGYRRPTPAEEFRIISNISKNRRLYDISRSDVYLMQYRFALDGEELDDMLYVYLPYVSQGGIMTIKNSKYVISPVVADIALSVCSDSVFIMLNRAKLTFRKTVGYMNVDGYHRSPYLVYSQIYNTDNKSRKNNITTLPHYLYCKYGLLKSFSNLGAAVRVVERSKFDANQYPSSDWVYCTSAEHTVSSRSSRYRKVTDLGILVPREQYNFRIESMIASFFYVVDRFPERITIHDYDHPTIWRVLLGKLIMNGSETEGKIIKHIDSHMESVDGYIDSMGREILIADGYPDIETIYDLMYVLIEELPIKIAQAGENIASLYGKRLVIHRYVNEDITQGISRIYFDVIKEYNNKADLTKTDLRRIFKHRLPYTTILSLNSGKAFVKSVSTASDCLTHKVTTITTMQTECGKRASKKGPTFGEAQYADASIAELGGITNLPDRDPTGRSSLNLMAMTDSNGTLMANPKHQHILGPAQEDIRRK